MQFLQEMSEVVRPSADEVPYSSIFFMGTADMLQFSYYKNDFFFYLSLKIAGVQKN